MYPQGYMYPRLGTPGLKVHQMMLLRLLSLRLSRLGTNPSLLRLQEVYDLPSYLGR